jgi:hypothetical protein
MRVKKLLLLFLMLAGSFFCKAQNRDTLFHDAGIYTSFEWTAHEPLTVTPQVWIYLKDYYFEARYNYEDLKTFSLYFGKSFYTGKKASIEITPMVGGVVGTINGISPGLNFSLDYLRFSTSTQTQYTFDLKNSGSSFYWDWTNFSFGLGKHFGLGGSVQIYRPQSGEATIDAGPMINFKIGSLQLEAFSYNFWQEQPLWALGVQYTFK